MKKRRWKPQPTDPSTAVDIPKLKNKEKKKKGVPFWLSWPSSSRAIYGTIEGVEGATEEALGVEASQAAASAATQAVEDAVPALEDIFAGEGVEAGLEAAPALEDIFAGEGFEAGLEAAPAASEVAEGFLGRLAGSVASYWPSGLAGNLVAGALLLVTAAAVAGGAALFAKASSMLPGIPLSALGGIAIPFHYSKAPSNSLMYAAAAARGLPGSPPPDAGIKAADAALPTAPAGQAAGGPVGSELVQGTPTLDNVPWGQDFFGGASGSFFGGDARAPAGVYTPYAVKNGQVGGRFSKTLNAGGKGGQLVMAANTGSPFESLGRFGTGDSSALGVLRNMMTYIPGMVKTGPGTSETPAQLSAEQFDASNLIGAASPSGVSLNGAGITPVMSGNPPPGGTGANVNNSCAQQNMVWNGSSCVDASGITPGSASNAPWMPSMNAMNMMLPIAAILILIGGTLVMIGMSDPFLSFLIPIGQMLAGIGALLGAMMLVMGSGVMGGNGQKTQGSSMIMAGAITIAGAMAAMGGGIIGALVAMVVGAAAGILSVFSGGFFPSPSTPSTPTTSSSGGSSSSSSGSGSTGG